MKHNCAFTFFSPLQCVIAVFVSRPSIIMQDCISLDEYHKIQGAMPPNAKEYGTKRRLTIGSMFYRIGQ